MSISKDIKPVLFYLRRFSRALNGSQEAGDAYLTATLEHLLDNLSAFNREMPTRIAFYQLYLDVWSSTHLGETDIHPSDAAAFEHNLAALSPRGVRLSFFGRSKAFPFLRQPRSWASTRSALQGCSTRRPRHRPGTRHQDLDHRGRANHRDGSRNHSRGSWSPCRRRGAGPSPGSGFCRAVETRTDHFRYSTCRRQLGHRRGERHRHRWKQACHFHHGISGPVSQHDRQPARTGVHFVQALQSRLGQSRGEPGAVLG